MGNSKLAAHLQDSPNAAYLSLDILQNELITLIGEEILSSISSEVKDASCFAAIAYEEATDKSIKSQFSIVVRYLKSDTLTERCVGAINQSSLKSKAYSGYNLVSFEVSKLVIGKNDWVKAMMERVLCLGKKKALIVRVLSTSCICSLFGICIEFSFGKIWCNT